MSGSFEPRLSPLLVVRLIKFCLPSQANARNKVALKDDSYKPVATAAAEAKVYYYFFVSGAATHDESAA